MDSHKIFKECRRSTADIILDVAHVLKAIGCRRPISSRQSLEGKKPVSGKRSYHDMELLNKFIFRPSLMFPFAVYIDSLN
jgi:hypothetical protein